MTPLSLRTRLTLSFTAILGTLLIALGLVYYRALARQLDAEATADLGELTSAVHGYLLFSDDGPTLVYDQNDPDEVAFIAQVSQYYQVYDLATGRRLTVSPALEPLGLHYTLEEIRAFGTHPQIRDIETDRGRIRLSTSVINPAPGASYLLQVGLSLGTMETTLRRFLWLSVLSVPVSLLVAAVVGRWLAARALAPLARVAAATRAIDVRTLQGRLPVRGTGDELDRVAEAFNDTLARLEQTVGDMKQFSTALAHELRTPLAVLRGEAELALTEQRSPEEYRRGLSSQIEELDRLARLINQLLTLARAEAGEIPLARQPVDLAALASSLADQLDPVAQAKQISLECRAPEAATVIGDAGWLERLLLNLLDNAVKFTRAGGRVVLSVTHDEHWAIAEVRDTGVGIAADALPHIFERFYQADPSRSRNAEGVGLGLSLARWIAQRHGATIEAASRPGEGTTVTVRLPLAP
jgi:heavy metal sensor kinase